MSDHNSNREMSEEERAEMQAKLDEIAKDLGYDPKDDVITTMLKSIGGNMEDFEVGFTAAIEGLNGIEQETHDASTVLGALCAVFTALDANFGEHKGKTMALLSSAIYLSSIAADGEGSKRAFTEVFEWMATRAHEEVVEYVRKSEEEMETIFERIFGDQG